MERFVGFLLLSSATRPTDTPLDGDLRSTFSGSFKNAPTNKTQ